MTSRIVTAPCGDDAQTVACEYMRKLARANCEWYRSQSLCQLVQRCIASTECEWCRFHDDTHTKRQLLPCTDACELSRGGATAALAMPKPPSTKRPLQECSRNVSTTRLLHRIVVWRWSDASQIEDRQLLYCACACAPTCACTCEGMR